LREKAKLQVKTQAILTNTSNKWGLNPRKILYFQVPGKIFSFLKGSKPGQ